MSQAKERHTTAETSLYASETAWSVAHIGMSGRAERVPEWRSTNTEGFH